MAGTTNHKDFSTFHLSSSSHRWNVFLSFRGEDTRKNFTGHLYTALDQAGIRTFKDDPELRTGEEISSELLKAIQDSKMSIVVFSKNYASSVWCLDELVEILECKRSKGQVALPVFYDVDPSDVRHQIGSFAEAFEKHKKRFMTNMDKVEKWRVALTEAANLSGYHLNNDANGHEADLVQKIVKDVLTEVYPKDLNVPDYLVGIDSRAKDIYSKLSIGLNDVRFIGIYGMGGIGKTTIVKSIYNGTFHHFEGSCFVENVRETFEEARGLLSLLEQLVFQLLKLKNFKVASVETGISLLKQTLCSKRVLIILDDVDQLSQMKSLAGQWNWFGPGSRIIITTRDECLLDKVQVDLRYEMKELDNYESLELFSRHAFRNAIPSKDFMELSKDIVGYAGGLPLALEVLGSNLFGRTMVEWKSVFEKLQHFPDNQILEKLKISYDGLKDDKVQDIFLDIACFFRGMDKDDAINILDGCGFYPEIGISILKGRSLLIIDGENKLRMHDLIRDMGREIVRRESVKKPRKRSRLWFHEDAYDVLKNPKGTDTIEGIKLVMPMLKQVLLSTKAFEKMHKLRLLHIGHVHLTGNFENLFEELRWLCWQYSPECLPSSFNPPKLVFLDMQYSSANELWKGTKNLQHLKILNVSYSQFLTSTPDFEGVGNLEKLLVQSCSSLVRIHPSIGILVKLVHLNFEGCFNLEQLPEQLGNMKSLTKLDAAHTAIEHIPDSIRHLGRLVELNLNGCENLRNLPSSFCYLTSLEVLGLANCINLESLPEHLGNMKNLTKLDACGTAIEQISDSIGHLGRLVELHLNSCKNLRSLPSSICYLTSLEVLDLADCFNLESLPEQLGIMGCLYFLDLINCSSLRSIYEFPPHLYEQHLACCSSLKSLRKFPPNFQKLRLINCTSLQSVMQFPLNLVELDLTNCISLQTIPELPPNIIVVYARGCTSLKRLPNLSRMKHLRELGLDNCNSLRSLAILPPNLGGLDLTNCFSLRSLPKLPPNLYLLNLSGCNSLESLPELPPYLENLYVSDCGSLKLLPDLPINLGGLDLTNLELTNCSSLQSLPKLPTHLYDLVLTNCNSLQSLPELPPDLRSLKVSACRSLQSLPDLPCNLCYLNASSCRSLKELPNLSKLKELQALVLMECNSLTFTFTKCFLAIGRSKLRSYDIYPPSNEIPEWFSYQRKGSSISFRMPLDVKNSLLGIAIWVVYDSQIQVVVSNKTDGTEFKSSSSIWYNGIHSWVSYIPKPFSMKSGDRIEVSFRRVMDEDVKVEMCGIHLVYEQDTIQVGLKRPRDITETIYNSKRLKL